jgi:hypothetical protein
MNKILFLIIFTFFTGCTAQTNIKSDQVKRYFDGFKASNYKTIKGVIADSLIITEGDYIMKFTPESYYKHFKWDSVFKPDYKVLEIKNQDDQIVVTAAVKSLRFKFLKNNPLICKRKFYFEKGKINSIKNLDCIDADWEIWQKERDSLVAWIKLNRPELDGFINDLSEDGAINYLKAIALYRKQVLE